jgi:hypothetical protein
MLAVHDEATTAIPARRERRGRFIVRYQLEKWNKGYKPLAEVVVR